MNIVQLIEKVRHWRDIVSSTRVTPEDITEDIRTAINNIIKDRYDNFKAKKDYSFQSTQNLRDQLGDLVKMYGVPAMGTNLIQKTLFPTDYRHIVSATVNIDGKIYAAIPKGYDEFRSITIDPFLAPTIDFPAQVYYSERNTGLEVQWGNVGTLINMTFYYIKEPVRVEYGTEILPGTNMVIGDIVIAVEVTVYNSVTYQIGQLITIVPGFLTITSGKVVKGWVGTDLPLLLHEEIALNAANIGLKITENTLKSNALEIENMKQ